MRLARGDNSIIGCGPGRGQRTLLLRSELIDRVLRGLNQGLPVRRR